MLCIVNMDYRVKVGGILEECRLTKEEFCFTSNSTSVHIKTEDIIGCEVVRPYFYFRQYALYLWYIKTEGKKLTKTSIHISGDENVCEKLRKDIQEKLQKLTKRPKSLLVLINPIGGNKTALKDYKNTVEPVFKLSDIKCHVIVSERQKHMVDVIQKYDLTDTDGIVILGGDGSFSEVVNVLMRKEQDKAGIDIDDPTAKIRPITIPIASIPTGSGNFLAIRRTGLRDVLNSTLHIIKGNVSLINMTGVYADNRLINYAGITTSYGVFTDLLYYSDKKYRWLGRMRYYVVPIWLNFFKKFVRSFEAELTLYANVTEKQTSSEDKDDQKQVLVEGQPLEEFKTYTKDSVVIDGKFTCVALGNGQMLDTDRTVYIMDDHVFTTITFVESMTQLQLLGFLKESLCNTEVTGNFFKFVNTRGIKIKVKGEKKNDGSEDDFIAHIIQVDGEIHEINELEIQCWLHQRVVPLYTSTL